MFYTHVLKNGGRYIMGPNGYVMIKSQGTLSDKLTLSDSDNIPFDLYQSYA